MNLREWEVLAVLCVLGLVNVLVVVGVITTGRVVGKEATDALTALNTGLIAVLVAHFATKEK